MYGLAHCLIDRSGCVIGVNLPLEKEPLSPSNAPSWDAQTGALAAWNGRWRFGGEGETH
jgi:hypothetical protein